MANPRLAQSVGPRDGHLRLSYSSFELAAFVRAVASAQRRLGRVTAAGDDIRSASAAAELAAAEDRLETAAMFVVSETYPGTTGLWAGQIVRIEDEYLEIAEAGDDSITVDRGILGTRSSPHATGSELVPVALAEKGAADGDLHYVHDQSEAAAVWAIEHNLGKHPSVTVTDTAHSVVIGDVEYPDEHHVVLRFSAPFSGVAYLN